MINIYTSQHHSCKRLLVITLPPVIKIAHEPHFLGCWSPLSTNKYVFFFNMASKVIISPGHFFYSSFNLIHSMQKVFKISIPNTENINIGIDLVYWKHNITILLFCLKCITYRLLISRSWSFKYGSSSKSLSKSGTVTFNGPSFFSCNGSIHSSILLSQDIDFSEIL